MDIRKLVTVIEETRREAGRDVGPPVRKVAVAAVIHNPFAGRYVEDLATLADWGEQLGGMLGAAAAAALGAGEVESYGKAGIVGTAGELEHVAALLHPKLGKPLRAAVGGGTSIIPSVKKRAAAGAGIDIPLHYKDAAFVRSHFDGIELRIADAPASDEIVLAVAVTDGGRPHPRVGGLTKEEATGEDGLR